MSILLSCVVLVSQQKTVYGTDSIPPHWSRAKRHNCSPFHTDINYNVPVFVAMSSGRCWCYERSEFHEAVANKGPFRLAQGYMKTKLLIFLVLYKYALSRHGIKFIEDAAGFYELVHSAQSTLDQLGS